MPAAIGVALLGAELAGTTIVAGLTIGELVGGVALTGALIGLQTLLAPKPPIPKPEDGVQTRRQPIPPRFGAYGRVRLGGSYMLYEVQNGRSYDVLALLSGKIGGFLECYLHEDPVVVEGSPTPSGRLQGYVLKDVNDHYGQNGIFIDTRLGLPVESAYDMRDNGDLSSIWTSAHRGDGIASAAMICGAFKQEDFSKVFPNQLPEPSFVMDAYPVWDPRDGSQSRDNPATWKVSSNPVLQIIDYLTNPEHGCGDYDYDISIAPVLDALMVEANLCDEAVATVAGSQKRYTSNGFYQFDNKPEAVLGSGLSTCDGWMAENGDGSLALKVGVYRAPTVTISERHKLALNVKYGVSDEEAVNELTLSFTSPDHKYKDTPLDAWRDEASISRIGKVRSQALGMTWVQQWQQARRLAKRSMQRLNPAITGTIVTTLYGLRALGERWIRLQLSPLYAGLEDAVVEVQKATIDLQAGRVTIEFIAIDPNAIDAWDPETEEGDAPFVPVVLTASPPPVAANVSANATGATQIDVEWDDPGRPDVGWIVRYGLEDDGTGHAGPTTDVTVTPTVSGSRLRASISPPTPGAYLIQVAAYGARTGDFSDPVISSTAVGAPNAPVDLASSVSFGTVTLTWTNPNDSRVASAKVYHGNTFGSAVLVAGPLYGAANQALSATNAPGTGTHKYWVTAVNATGGESSPAGPETVTI